VLYVAPPGYHVLCEADGLLSLSVEEPENFSRPSIDVLFESAAAAYGEGVVAIILTGGNADGARGLATVRRAGGITVVQDPKTAEVPAMPLAALSMTPDVDHVLSIEDIAALLVGMGEGLKEEASYEQDQNPYR
jgi:two-component system chemotaxis response regulator CheB